MARLPGQSPFQRYVQQQQQNQRRMMEGGYWSRQKRRDGNDPTRRGACFVATACFGSLDHPTVIALRRFRDDVLDRNALGRGFIDWYYRHGPRLATLLGRLPALKHPLRLVLTTIARSYSRRCFKGRDN
jgi:hypothetical protein